MRIVYPFGSATVHVTVPSVTVLPGWAFTTANGCVAPLIPYGLGEGRTIGVVVNPGLLMLRLSVELSMNRMFEFLSTNCWIGEFGTWATPYPVEYAVLACHVPITANVLGTHDMKNGFA